MVNLRSFVKVAAAGLAFGACSGSSETTSFRTTDAGTHEVRVAREHVANVRVSSQGGYIGTSDEPMTQIGFEIENASTQPIGFDTRELGLVVFGGHDRPLPPTRFVSVTPLGPEQVAIAPATTTTLSGYFLIPARPRMVEQMRVRWTLRVGDQRYDATTSFVREDDFPVIDYQPGPTELPTGASSTLRP